MMLQRWNVREIAKISAARVKTEKISTPGRMKKYAERSVHSRPNGPGRLTWGIAGAGERRRGHDLFGPESRVVAGASAVANASPLLDGSFADRTSVSGT